MKALITGLFAGMILCGISLASAAAPRANGATQAGQPPQPAPSGSAQPNEPIRIAPGSVIPVELTKSIDAKKAKTGDEVEARVTQDLKAGTGEVIVPKDSKVLGHVTEAQARNKEEKESQLTIAFDHAVTKNGEHLAMPMSIQAIIAPAALNNFGGNNNGPSSPAAAGVPSSQSGSGRGMPAASPTQAPSTPNSDFPGNAGPNNPRQPITGETQGVVGIPDLNLSSAPNAAGSRVSSQRSNVKLESGTMMLLRVTQ